MFRDCVCYIFASFFCMSKRAFVKQEKCFLVNLENSCQ